MDKFGFWFKAGFGFTVGTVVSDALMYMITRMAIPPLEKLAANFKAEREADQESTDTDSE